MTVESGSFSIAAMGDVMLDRDVGAHYESRPEDFALDDVRRLLGQHDIVCLNLENPVGTRGTPDPSQDPHVTFCAKPTTLEVVKRLGAHVVSLGNNHMLDYGETGLAETLEHLDAHGLKHVGAGRNYEEANRPLLMECKGRKVAFLSFAFIYSASTRMATRRRGGVADHRIGRILPRIRDLKRRGYVVIVLVHWGIEYYFYPLPYQMQQARRMIDHGASLVLGHGPHYPQGIEKYRGGEIVYSLGNFIFDEPYKYANRSFIYTARITAQGDVVDAEIHPVHIDNHVPRLVEGRRRERIENLVRCLSEVYPQKSKRFWQDLNNRYFSDLLSRSLRTRALKFLLLPSLSFYTGVGASNYLRKLRPRRLLGAGAASPR